MTGFEIAILFNELLTTVVALLETFMAALFAMLATAYFVAPKLTRAMSAIVVGLFTLFSALVIFLTFAATRRVAEFGGQLNEMASQIGSDLSWLFFVPAAVPILPAAVAIMLITAYVAGLLFFFHARREFRVG